MRVGELHHVAVAVPSIARALPFYTGVLGMRAGEVTDLPRERVRATFLSAGASLIELVEPTDDDSGVARFLGQRQRQTLHHICYLVPDLAGALRDLEARGAQLIDRAPRAGLAGNVAFIHPRAAGGVLIELLEAAGAYVPPHTGPR